MTELEVLRGFLGSFKNAESVTSELRALISVETGLEAAVATAARAGRVVLVTGSAGSGKTHLLAGLPSCLPDVAVVSYGDRRPRRRHVLVVPDATVLAPEERNQLLLGTTRDREGTVIAINEGPLREAAALDVGGPFSQGVSLLHGAQRGVEVPFDPSKPTVIDVGAFDPVENGVIARILELRSLHDLVQASACPCAESDCPRRRSWQQLRSQQVRHRLSEVVRLANAVDSGWLFRDIWDFVADVVIGGSCEDSPPTSPWFWRVFYGASRLSSSLREIADPEMTPIPLAEPHVWYSDWNSVALELLDAGELFTISRPDMDPRRFLFMKAQLLAAGAHFPPNVFLAHRDGGDAAATWFESRPEGLLHRINNYMSYGQLSGASTELDLWVDHSVERRTERSRSQVLIGRARAEDFEIRSSLAITNHPDSDSRVAGTNRFLVHKPSLASFKLDREKDRLMREGRSFLHSDRPHTDLEWDLLRFFASILATEVWRSEFGVLTTDFARMEGTLRRYRAVAVPPIVELAQ